MKAYNINGNAIQATNYADALRYVFFVKCLRTVEVLIIRDGEEMQLKLNIIAQANSYYLEDVIQSTVKDALNERGIDFDAFEVSINGVWLSSSEL